MCEICLQSNCPPRCPNAPIPAIYGHCNNCGENLTAEDSYYKDAGENVFCCLECAIEYNGIVQQEWEEGEIYWEE